MTVDQSRALKDWPSIARRNVIVTTLPDALPCVIYSIVLINSSMRNGNGNGRQLSRCSVQQ